MLSMQRVHCKLYHPGSQESEGEHMRVERGGKKYLGHVGGGGRYVGHLRQVWLWCGLLAASLRALLWLGNHVCC